MTDARSFWAWHRAGLAATLTTPAPAGASRAHVPARISLDTTHAADIPVDLLGPGDVSGLDPAEVNRTEPADGCPDFEPSAFPYIELRHADLPWRFTPEGPRQGTIGDPEHPADPAIRQQRLQPWIALVVVREDAATLTTSPAGGVALRCDAADLPDVREAWAWAHVQLTGERNGDDQAALSDPSRAFARIICPIRLEPDQRYLACLVPTYAAGLTAAGIEPPGGTGPLDPAWPATGDITLPVYHSWRFGTTDAGSFETLARRLRARPVPTAASGVPLRIDAAGWGAVAPPGTTVLMQGALRPLSATEAPPDAAFASSLATALSASGPGLVLRPPLYGQDHAAGSTTVIAGAPGWFSQLNTDARRRFAAGLAAWAVAVEQEDLCDRAWQQLADARSGDATGPAADVAAAVRSALETRHSSVMAPALAAMPKAASVTARMLRPGGSLARIGFGTSTVARTAASTTPAQSGDAFCPSFDDPALAALRATASEWILPGLADLPEDSIVLVRTNPQFVEAFLVGLNHALARELQWRRYPLDPTGTMFTSFWPSVTGGPPGSPPLAAWDAQSDLGSHVGEAGQLVLVLRGALLRRFPTTSIYLSGQVRDGAEQIVRPTLEASVGADTTLVGFPLSPQEILTPTTPGQVWSIVLQESILHARFGIDDAPADGTTATLRTWQDLDWGNPHLIGHRHVRIAGPLSGIGRPTGPTTPIGPPPTARWGADSAAMAAAFTRVPVRVRIPASLWLTTTGA